MPVCIIPRAPERKAPTAWQRLNVIWWAGDAERNPAWPAWRWFLRNPFCNFLSVIVGVSHRTRTVYALRPTIFDPAPPGWNYGVTIAPWRPPMPFVSYRGPQFEWITGWKINGTLAPFTFRRANSPNATPLP